MLSIARLLRMRLFVFAFAASLGATAAVAQGSGQAEVRSTQAQAQQMLDRAVAELKASGPRAYERFNDPKGDFVINDLYVYVVGVDDLVFRAHGTMPKLIGRSAATLRDATGKRFIADQADEVRTVGKGTLEYIWRNPVNGRDELKRALYQRVGDVFAAVGIYVAQ